jgi:DHA1 family bicyclomycin/chloramphenicol resistance-like MFS transporter
MADQRARLRPDSPAATALLTALVAIGSFSVSIYTPSMPALAADFSTTQDRVKLTLSLFLVGFALGQLVYGPLSDRFGRRSSLLGGLVLYVFGSLACAGAWSIDIMIWARFVQALGACAGPVLGRAVVRDVHGREGTARVLAWIGAATTLSPAIGPTLGGSVHVWLGWRANFLLLAVLGAVLLAACWRRLGETNAQRNPAATSLVPMLATYATLLRERRYLGYLLTGTGIFAGLYAWIAAAPFLFVQRLGFVPNHYGALTIVTTACYVLGSLAAARFTGRYGIDRMILVGCIVSVIGGVAMALLATGPDLTAMALIAPMMVFSFGMGLTLPNALAGGLLPFPRIAGAASALLGFAQMAAAASAAAMLAALPPLSAPAMAGTILFCAVAALLARLALLRP